jgi:transposase-like protein
LHGQRLDARAKQAFVRNAQATAHLAPDIHLHQSELFERIALVYGDTWHLDEVFCKINGQLVYLCPPVDQDGETLDILVQKRRNARAAKRFLRKLLKGLRYVPRAMVTDKLSSYGAAREELLPAVEHRRGGRLNNRAENSIYRPESANGA